MASVSSVERFLRSKRANFVIDKVLYLSKNKILSKAKNRKGKKSEKSCDKRGQLSLLKLPSVARILSKAKKSVLSVGDK